MNLGKRVVSAIAAISVVFSIVSPIAGANAAIYTELEAANKLASMNVINDKSATPSEYRIDDTISRREMLKIMMRLKNYHVPGTYTYKEVCEWNKFADLPNLGSDTDWACYYAEPALKLGMISANSKYNPNSRVTKAEALKMIMMGRWVQGYENEDEWAGYVDAAVDAGILVKDAVGAGIIAKAFTDYDTKAERGFVFVIAVNQTVVVVGIDDCDTNGDQLKCVDEMCVIFGELADSSASCYCGDNNENADYQICQNYCEANPDDEGCPDVDVSCEEDNTQAKCNIDVSCEVNAEQAKCSCDDYPDADKCEVVSDGDLTVRLSPNTAPSATVPGWISGLAAVTFDVTAGAEDATITSMTIQRNGISDADTLTALALFSENGRISKEKDDNQENNTQAQINLNNGWYTIPAWTTESITVVVNIEEIADKDEVEADEFMLQLVNVEAWWEVVFVWDLEGNKITVGSRDAALITIKDDSDVADVTVWDDSVPVLKFQVEWATDEDVSLENITFKASEWDALVNLENFVLKLDGQELAVWTVSGKYLTFKIEGGVTIAEDKTEDFVVVADVVGWAGDTYSFYIDQELDVRGVGQQFGYGLAVDITQADDDGELWDVTIEAGELALLDIDAEHDKIRADKENVELWQLKIMNIAGKDLELQKFGLKVALSNTTNVLNEVFTNFEMYNPETGETYELSTNDGLLTIGSYSDDSVDISLPEGDITYIIRADTLENVDAGTQVSLTLAIDGVSSTGEFYAEETNEDTQVTDITPSSLSWKKLTFIDAGATVANVPLADTTVVRGTAGEVAMEFEIESTEASDINVDEIIARLQTQNKLLTASAVWSNSTQQTDLTVIKTPVLSGWETYYIYKNNTTIIADYTTVSGDDLLDVTNALNADLIAKGYTTTLGTTAIVWAQVDTIGWIAGDPSDVYTVTINGMPTVNVPYNTNAATTLVDIKTAIDALSLPVTVAVPAGTITANNPGTPFTTTVSAVDWTLVPATLVNVPTIVAAGATQVDTINWLAGDAGLAASEVSTLTVITAPTVAWTDAVTVEWIAYPVAITATELWSLPLTATKIATDLNSAAAGSFIATVLGNVVTITDLQTGNVPNTIYTAGVLTGTIVGVGVAEWSANFGVADTYTVTVNGSTTAAVPFNTDVDTTLTNIKTAIDALGKPVTTVVDTALDTITITANVPGTAFTSSVATVDNVNTEAVQVFSGINRALTTANVSPAVKQKDILGTFAGDVLDTYTVTINWIPTVPANIPYNTSDAQTLADLAAAINATTAPVTATVVWNTIEIEANVAWIPFATVATANDWGLWAPANITRTLTTANLGSNYIRVDTTDALSFPAWQWSNLPSSVVGAFSATLTATAINAPAGTVYGVKLNGVDYITALGWSTNSLQTTLNAIPWITATIDATNLIITVSSNTAFAINNGPTTAMSAPVAATNQEISKVSLYADSADGTLLDEKSGTDIASDGTVTFDVDEDILSDTTNTYVITIDIVDGADAVANTPIIVDLVWVNAEDDDNDTVKVILSGTISTELSSTLNLTTPESPLYSDKATTVTESGVLIVAADLNNEDNKAPKNILGGESVVVYSTDVLSQNEEIDVETVVFTILWDYTKAIKNASIYLGDTLVGTNSSSDIVYDWTNTMVTFDNLTGLIIPEENKELKLAVTANTIGYQKIGKIKSLASISQVDFTNAEWVESGKDVADKSLVWFTWTNYFDIVPALITSSVVTSFGSESDIKLTVDAGANTKSTDNTPTTVKVTSLTFNQVGTAKWVATFSIKDSNGVLIDTKTASWVAPIIFTMWTYAISDNETFTISIDSGTTSGNSYGLELQRTGVLYTTSSDSFATSVDSNYSDEIELWEYNAN